MTVSCQRCNCEFYEKGRQLFLLLPLDCHTAETGELVNGGRSPFISTVDMGGRLCYSVLKILSLYSEFQITKFNRLLINNSAQVGQNFKNHFPTTWRTLQTPTSDQLGQKWGLRFLPNQSVRQIGICLLVFHATPDNG